MGRSNRERRIVRAVYTRNATTGAVGSHAMVNEQGKALKLPANSRVVGVYLRGVTAPTSAGLATIALGITGNTDAFKAATAFDNAAYGAGAYTKAENEVPLVVGGTAVQVLATVAVEALTAGKLELDIELIV